jgi:hypothetical protein
MAVRWLCQVTLLHRAPLSRPHHPPSLTASRSPFGVLRLPAQGQDLAGLARLTAGELLR